MRLLGVACALTFGLFLLDRLFLALEDRGWINWRRRGAARASVSSALAELEAQLRPPAREVQVAQRTEPRKTEDGDPPSPDAR